MSPDSDRPLGSEQRILVVGTGGQGVVTTARWLTRFFVARGHEVVSGQLHGMAQRGGSVFSSVMVDCGMSPTLRNGGADVVLGFEPVETARALPYISSKTAVLMNTRPVIPFVIAQQYVRGKDGAQYPRLETLTESIGAVTSRLVTLDATSLAEKAGSAKALNVVMLGCLFGSDLVAYEPNDFLKTLLDWGPPEVRHTNEQAFLSGLSAGRAAPLAEGVR